MTYLPSADDTLPNKCVSIVVIYGKPMKVEDFDGVRRHTALDALVVFRHFDLTDVITACYVEGRLPGFVKTLLVERSTRPLIVRMTIRNPIGVDREFSNVATEDCV